MDKKLEPPYLANDLFDAALAFTLKSEGGYSDDPNDRGGPTMCGITQTVYSAWLKKHNYPDNNVHSITYSEVEKLYREDYWDVCRLTDLLLETQEADLVIAIFDFAVNAGCSRAVKILQAELDQLENVDEPTVDGILGPHTIVRVLQNKTTADLCGLYNVRRRNFYRSLATQNKPDQKFLNGWLARVDNLTQYLKEQL